DVSVRELLAFEPWNLLVCPPAIVRHGGAVQASQVLDPTPALRVPHDPRVMLREVPLRVEDPDLGRTSEAFLRATLVAGLVVPPASCFMEARGSCPVRRKKNTAPTPYRSLAGVASPRFCSGAPQPGV